MPTNLKFVRGVCERSCLVAWMLLMVADTVMIGLSVELLIFGAILSFDQVTLIDSHTMPFLTLGLIALINFPVVMKLHSLGVAYLNFEIHENILQKVSETWENVILTFLDDSATRSYQLEKFVQEINQAPSAAERQERRREVKAWLQENKELLSEEDHELISEHLSYLKID